MIASGELFTDRLVIAIAALILNGLLGGPRKLHRLAGLYKPGKWLGAAVRALERKLNRDRRSVEDRRRRGVILTTTLVLLSAAAAFGLMIGVHVTAFGGLMEMVLLAAFLSLRQSADFAYALATRIGEGNAEAARAELAGTAWRNAAILDGHALCRAGVETLAVLFTERVVSLVFWYMLLGLPGLLVVRMVTLLADATAHGRDAFGWAPDRLAVIIHFIPSVLASLLVLFSSIFLPFCDMQRAARCYVLHLADPYCRRRELAVFGAALGVALGGPASVYAQGPWVGGAVARAQPGDVRRAVLLQWFSAFLLLFALMLLLS